MKRLLVFVGESGSGKSTLISRLTGKYPDQFRKVVTCTSRPPRTGEINGADYHFLPKEYFIDASLVLTKETSDGFQYGTKTSDLHSNTHHLLLTLRLVGVRKLIDLGLKNIIVVRISISEELKTERMRKRGDTEAMIINRLQIDAAERIDVDLEQFPIQIVNVNAIQTPDEQIGCILEALQN